MVGLLTERLRKQGNFGLGPRPTLSPTNVALPESSDDNGGLLDAAFYISELQWIEAVTAMRCLAHRALVLHRVVWRNTGTDLCRHNVTSDEQAGRSTKPENLINLGHSVDCQSDGPSLFLRARPRRASLYR